MRFVLAAVVALGLVVVFVGGSVFYLSWSACLGGERAALKEFPHYGDPQSTPYPSQGSCYVRYTTQATRKEVLGHYDEQLRKNGWELLGFRTVYRPPKGMEMPVKRLSDLSEAPESAGGSLAARRDGYNYHVSYEPPSKEDPDVPDDEALVMASVSKGSGNTPPPCGPEEKEALAEFSHYGGRNNLGMGGNQKGACTTGYGTQASEERVVAYYEEKLTEHGWKVKQFSTKRGGRIEASRDGLRYVVHYRDLAEHGTNVRVEVYKT